MHARTATGPYARTRRLRPPSTAATPCTAGARRGQDGQCRGAARLGLAPMVGYAAAGGGRQPAGRGGGGAACAALRLRLARVAPRHDVLGSATVPCRAPTSPSRVTPLCHTSVSHLCAPPPICPRMLSSGILPLTSRCTPHIPCRCHLSKLGDVHDAEPFQLGLLGAPLTLTLAARCAPNPNPSC